MSIVVIDPMVKAECEKYVEEHGQPKGCAPSKCEWPTCHSQRILAARDKRNKQPQRKSPYIGGVSARGPL